MHDLDIDKIAEILSSPSTGLEITGMTENIIEAEKNNLMSMIQYKILK
ncbi:MAG: hypothetical protein IPH28_19810 [Cytophagaceae bacterium]|nr:hypothetical protein [Cytophagaceae bacterium]